MAVVRRGAAFSAGMPGWRSPSAFSRARKIAWVTKLVSAVWSERSSTVIAFLPLMAAISSASGKGCSSLMATRPTFLPWLRR